MKQTLVAKKKTAGERKSNLRLILDVLTEICSSIFPFSPQPCRDVVRPLINRYCVRPPSFLHPATPSCHVMWPGGAPCLACRGQCGLKESEEFQPAASLTDVQVAVM